MDAEILFPALCEASVGKLSPEEFQKKLYAWFEEKGLVADLRCYLRVLMINKLRNASKFERKTNFSLKKQALSLVIAEHLLREGCHYTLSIFSTEVPSVATQIPFSLFETHYNRDNDYKFDEDSVMNLLQLLGVRKNSDNGVRISSLYFRNFGSLLNCFINTPYPVENLENDEFRGDFNDLNRILNIFGVPLNTVKELWDKIRIGFRQEEEKTNLLLKNTIEEMRNKIAHRENQMRELIDEVKILKDKNGNLKEELKSTKKQITQIMTHESALNAKEEFLKSKLDEISKLEHKDPICPLQHCTDSCKINEELINENSRLKEMEKNKNIEHERMQSRINLLEKDLESAQVKIQFLNTCLLHSSQMNLQSSKIIIQYLYSEIIFFLDDSVEISEESSDHLTDEVLKQVRLKLQRLEQESLKLDLKFRNLQIKS